MTYLTHYLTGSWRHTEYDWANQKTIKLISMNYQIPGVTVILWAVACFLNYNCSFPSLEVASFWLVYVWNMKVVHWKLLKWSCQNQSVDGQTSSRTNMIPVWYAPSGGDFHVKQLIYSQTLPTINEKCQHWDPYCGSKVWRVFTKNGSIHKPFLPKGSYFSKIQSTKAPALKGPWAIPISIFL